MKKAIFLVVIISLILAVWSCERAEIADPPWDGPAGFYILVEGKATPAVLFIDGKIHTSEIYVRVTDSKGTPLAGETIFFEQLSSTTSTKQQTWGYFEKKSYTTIKRVTNANGEVIVKFYSPVNYYQSIMFIHALMQVDDRAYRGSTIPQDYIAISMYKSGTAAAPVMN